MTFFRYVETKMRCLWCYLFVVVLSIKWCLFFESLVIFLLPQFQFDSIIPHLLIKSTPKNFNFFLIYFRLFKIQFSALIVSFPFALMESQNSINSSRERVNPACLLKTFWRGNLSFFVCFFYELLPFFCFISTQLWEHIVMINIHTHSTQLCVSRATRRKKNWIFFITNCLFSQNIIWERERWL